VSRLEDLGIRPLINAWGTFTILGGSRLAPPVAAAMTEVSDSFLDYDLLASRVGERLAELTRNEAAMVTNGAAAGTAIAIAACVAGTDPERIMAFPAVGGRSEVIVQRGHRNGYDYSARMTGARLVEIGTPDGASLADLEAAFTADTAAVLVFAGEAYDRGAIPLTDLVAAAHRRGIPVVIDNAAGVPPIASLWHYTRDLGADVVVFSGGKGLRGPASSGLVLGRRDLIAACVANSSPRHSLGRPMKVGKEELVGVLAAVEWSLAQDEPGYLEAVERSVDRWIDGLRDVPGIRVERGLPLVAAEPIPRALIRLEGSDSEERNRIIADIRARGVVVGPDGDTSIILNAQTVRDHEVEPVLDAVRTVLLERAGAPVRR
jgi:L-seryl-tRNA(Ser) seleniumtransferase